MEKYNIKSINFIDAQKIWETSPNACIYNNPSFLKNYENIKLFSVSKGNEIMCCWPIYNLDKKMLIPNFFYYFGPFWSKKILEQPIHSWLSISNNVYSKFIEFFSKTFDEINFQLHHTLLDVRIFDWWNYHNKKEKRFNITPKYSAKIDFEKNQNQKKIISNYRYVRRYEIKNFSVHENKIKSCECSIEDMIELYFETNAEKYSKNKKKELINDLVVLINLANKGFGSIQSYKDADLNKLIYFNLVLFDKTTAHLVLNSSENYWKKKGIMAWGINNLLNNNENKFKNFDFNGANSPLRGDDKHSYGSKEKLYFQFKY